MDIDLTNGQELKRRAYSVLGAEGAALAVSVGSLAIAKTVAPTQIERIKEVVAEKVVLPWMKKSRPWREVMTEKCKKNPELGDVCGPLLDPTKPENEEWLRKNKPKETREDRAKERAGVLVDLSIMLIPGLISRIWSQKFMDSKMGVAAPQTPKYIYAKAIDTAVVGVSMLGLMTVGHEKTFPMKVKMRDILQKVGISREKAGDISNYLTYAQIPNAIGMVANLGAMTAFGAADKKAKGQVATPGR